MAHSQRPGGCPLNHTGGEPLVDVPPLTCFCWRAIVDTFCKPQPALRLLSHHTERTALQQQRQALQCDPAGGQKLGCC